MTSGDTNQLIDDPDAATLPPAAPGPPEFTQSTASRNDLARVRLLDQMRLQQPIFIIGKGRLNTAGENRGLYDDHGLLYVNGVYMASGKL